MPLNKELKPFKENNSETKEFHTVGIDKEEMQKLKDLRKTLNPNRNPKEDEGFAKKLTFKNTKEEAEFNKNLTILREGLEIGEGKYREVKEQLAAGIGEQLMMLDGNSIVEFSQGGKKERYDVYEYYTDIMKSLFGEGEIMSKEQLIQKFEGGLGKVGNGETVKQGYMDILGTTLSSQPEMSGEDRMKTVKHAFDILGKYFERREYVKKGEGSFQENIEFSTNLMDDFKGLIDPNKEKNLKEVTFEEFYKKIIDLGNKKDISQDELKKNIGEILSLKDADKHLIKFRTFEAGLQLKEGLKGKVKFEKGEKIFELDVEKKVSLKEKMNQIVDLVHKIDYPADFNDLYLAEKNGDKEEKILLKDYIAGMLDALHSELELQKLDPRDNSLDNYGERYKDSYPNKNGIEIALDQVTTLRQKLDNTNGDPLMIDSVFLSNIKEGIINNQADIDYKAKTFYQLDKRSPKNYFPADKYYLEQISNVRRLNSIICADIKKYFYEKTLKLDNLSDIDNVDEFADAISNNGAIRELYLNLDLFGINKEKLDKFVDKLKNIIEAKGEGFSLVIDCKYLTAAQIDKLNSVSKSYSLNYKTQSINYDQFQALSKHKGNLALPFIELPPAKDNISSEQSFRNFLQNRDKNNPTGAELTLGNYYLKDYEMLAINELIGGKKHTIKIPNMRRIDQNKFENINTSGLNFDLPSLLNKDSSLKLLEHAGRNKKNLTLGLEQISDEMLVDLGSYKGVKLGIGVGQLDSKILNAITKVSKENNNNVNPTESLKTLDLFKLQNIDVTSLKALLGLDHKEAKANDLGVVKDKKILNLLINSIQNISDSEVAKLLGQFNKVELKGVKKISEERIFDLIVNSPAKIDLSGVEELENSDLITYSKNKLTKESTILDIVAMKEKGGIKLGNIKKLPTGEEGKFITNENISSTKYLNYTKNVFGKIFEHEKEGVNVEFSGFLQRHYESYKRNPENYGK